MTANKKKILITVIFIAALIAALVFIRNANDKKRYDELQDEISKKQMDITVIPDSELTEEELAEKEEILEREEKENEIFERVLGKTFEYTNPILGNTQTITFTSRSKELLVVGSYIRTESELIEDESDTYEFEFNEDFNELKISNASDSQKGNFELTEDGFIFNNAEFVPSDIEALIRN